MLFIHRSVITVTTLMLVGTSAYPASEPPTASTNTHHATEILSTATLDVRAGPTTIVVNASSGGLLTVKRAAGNGAAGVDFLDGAIGGEEPLFTLGLTRLSDLGGPLRVLATDFRKIVVQQSAAGGDVIATFSDHPGAFGSPVNINATVIITPNATTGRVHFRLAIGRPAPPPQRGSWAVQTAIFPGVKQRVDSIGPGDGVLHPCGEGAVLPGPFVEPRSFGQRAGFTPRGGSVQRCGAAQVAARFTDEVGLVIETHDTGGHAKQWLLDMIPHQYLRLEVQHFFPEVAGAPVSLEYDTTVGTCGAGGWRAAADLYKSWSRHQSWAATLLTERLDIPDILLTGAPGVIAGIQNEQGYSAGTLLGPNLELLPAYLASFKRRLNTSRITFVPYGWENRGTWAGINYFPAVPSNEAWSTVNRKLADTGDATMFLVSGSWWVVKREASSGGPAFDDSDELSDPKKTAMLVKTLRAQNNGSTVWYDDQYNLTKATQPWRGLSVELCHGHPAAQRTLREIFDSVRGLGVSVGSFDQDISVDQFEPCYDPTHPHGPGLGPYMLEGMLTTLSGINSDTRSAGRKFGLSSEQTAEIGIAQMGTFWSRQFAPIDYPTGGFQGVGLFSYLYHEYIPAMAAALVQGQGVLGTRPHPLLRVKAMADALTRGIALVPFTQDVPVTSTSEWTSVVSAAFFLYGGVAPRFTEHLVFGETMHPVVVECANLSVWLMGGNKTHPEKKNLTIPAVVAGTFRGRSKLPTRHTSDMRRDVTTPLVSRGAEYARGGPTDPGVGSVIVNVANTSQPARIITGPSTQDATSLTLLDAHRNPLRKWTVADGRIPAVVDVTLKPFEVLFLLASNETSRLPNSVHRTASDDQ